MTIQEMEILIECKRLVERMLHEKRNIVKKLEESDKGDERARRVVMAQIARMERALAGQSPIPFYETHGAEV